MGVQGQIQSGPLRVVPSATGQSLQLQSRAPVDGAAPAPCAQARFLGAAAIGT